MRTTLAGSLSPLLTLTLFNSARHSRGREQRLRPPRLPHTCGLPPPNPSPPSQPHPEPQGRQGVRQEIRASRMLSEVFAQGRGIRGGSGAKQTDGGELFDWSPSIPGTPAQLTFRSRKKKNKERATSASISSQLQVRGKRKKKEERNSSLLIFACFVCLFFAV